MLKLTKRTEYALIALVHLADREGSADGPLVSAREISERYPVPKRLVAEVLKDLCKADLVASQRGASGGYALARPAAQISLGEVIAALEGRPSLTGCETAGAGGAAGHGACEVEPVCPIKSPMQRVRLGIWDLMVRTSLLDLAQGQRPDRRGVAAPTSFPTATSNNGALRTRATPNTSAPQRAHVLPASTP